jgi:hypothetical protein
LENASISEPSLPTQTYKEAMNVQEGENGITIQVTPSAGPGGRPINSAER